MFLATIFFLLLIWFLLPYGIRIVQVKGLRKICRRKRAIVLTYDDGPTIGATERVLAVLNKFNVFATFFVLGRKANEYPQLLSDMVGCSQEIGAHSYSHLNAWKCSPLRVYRDTERGLEILRNYGGSMLYRPPYGKMTLLSMMHVYVRGYRLAWWTIDSTDTWDSPASVSEVIQQIRENNGGVVLMHDLNSSIGPALTNNYMVDLSEGILEFAENEGYKVCTMSSLFS
jgi:peptidoglycan/xylan/chitin deacetylase (PgdA/CDA1 family)